MTVRTTSIKANKRQKCVREIVCVCGQVVNGKVKVSEEFMHYKHTGTFIEAKKNRTHNSFQNRT